jgi:hypothetical protein
MVSWEAIAAICAIVGTVLTALGGIISGMLLYTRLRERITRLEVKDEARNDILKKILQELRNQ